MNAWGKCGGGKVEQIHKKEGRLEERKRNITGRHTTAPPRPPPAKEHVKYGKEHQHPR